MQLVIDSHRYSDPPFVTAGGIGEIYRIGNGTLAKVFFVNNRTFERRSKVLALCNLFEDHVSQFGANRYAFPERPAYELVESFDALAGFSMRDFGSIPKIGDLAFDLSTNTFREADSVKLDDSSAIALVYQIFEWLDTLHRARIVLGDVNDGNVLYSSHLRQAVIVDIDSAQIGQFYCLDVTPEFMAPELKIRGTNLSGGYIFDSGTDVFALAAVCFEFLIGAKPHKIYVDPPQSTIQNKDNGVSSIRCFAMGHSWLTALGLSYVDVPENRMIEKRLAWLQQQDRNLYDFFFSVFVKNERNNILSSLPVTDPRHPGYHFLIESGFKSAIDNEAQKRAKVKSARPKVVAQSGKSLALPDSGFLGLVASLSNAPQHAPKVVKQTQIVQVKGDPPQLLAFFKQFNLSI